ncbi:MAG: endonuclease III domain-containing protein [Spirochaetia bacterium]
MKPRAEQAARIFRILNGIYPDKSPLLTFADGFQLLIGVILSAQTTDRQVNRVTPELFRRFPSAEELARAPAETVEEIIRPVGFFRSKTRNIIAASEALARYHGGTVPGTMEELIVLPGVGRKSANVIRGHLYGLPAVIVDTHFARVTRRLGLLGEDTADPAKIEREIRELVPPEDQTGFSMVINLHGRAVCGARKPLCAECPVNRLCPSAGTFSSRNP